MLFKKKKRSHNVAVCEICGANYMKSFLEAKNFRDTCPKHRIFHCYFDLEKAKKEAGL